MLRVLVVLGMLASPAVADSRERTPSVTVSAGAVLPMFLVYEVPGPWVSGSAAWPIREPIQAVASVDTGLLYARGSTRFLGSLGAGVRVAPVARVPLWVQLGLGTTGFVERFGVVLPERAVRATDLGIALTGDLAIGVRIGARWQIALGYDHQLVSTGPERMYTGTKILRHGGTATFAVGRQL